MAPDDRDDPDRSRPRTAGDRRLLGPDAVDAIFDRFSRSTDSPGAGLGLAIAKSLVEAHGGTIRAESAPAQGTRIAFTLPIAARS